MIQKPEFLKPGDTVCIISPASPIVESEVAFAKNILLSWGLHVVFGKNSMCSHGVFAGTDSERLADLQEALDNPLYKAIFCSRGGYGSIRIASEIDFSAFLKKPKWLIGFSDITVLLARIFSLHIASLHAVMPKNFQSANEQSLESLRNILFGTIKPGELTCCNPCSNNINGYAEGMLVGGNLSVLYSMRGVSFEFDYTNKILFIEDLCEYYYHIDRIMQNFKLGGVFDSISGLVVGHMSDLKQGNNPHLLTIEEIILDAVEEYAIPVCFNAPIGHEPLNNALVIGGIYSMKVDSKSADLQLYL